MRKYVSPISILVTLSCLVLSGCAGTALGNAGSPTASASEAVTAATTPTAPASTPQNTLPPQTVQSLFNGFLATIPQGKGYGYVQAEALKADLAFADKPFLLDVRDPSEVKSNGYILGAVNIPLRSLLSNLDKLPAQNANIIIYSKSGNRSGMALAALMLLGYSNVHDLAGGFSSWVHASQFPITTGLTPAAPQVLTPNPVISNQDTYNMLNSFLSNLPDNFYQVDAITLSKELTSGSAPTIIDMNTTSDHQQFGYIPGAVFIAFSDFFNNINKLPSKDSPIVIYAVGGGHSSILVMGLREMGYTNVSSLEGGIISWKAADLPTKTVPTS